MYKRDIENTSPITEVLNMFRIVVNYPNINNRNAFINHKMNASIKKRKSC